MVVSWIVEKGRTPHELADCYYDTARTQEGKEAVLKDHREDFIRHFLPKGEEGEEGQGERGRRQ